MHHHKLFQFHSLFTWHYMWVEQLLSLLLAILIFVAPAGAAMRFQERSLYMKSSLPGATTSYTISFRYMSPAAVGSVDILACIDPIPYHECVTPSGFDASNAVLSNQSGETGFSIQSKSTNHIVMTRLPGVITNGTSSYTFDNIVNPTDTSQSFSIRLKSHSTTNATGAQVDFGSVKGQVTNAIMIETQVPPMLIFCVAGLVEENCTSTNDNYFTDMGTLAVDSTLVAQSQMAVGTNATGGFAITINGAPPSAGTNYINPLTTPTESIQGVNQFGINLVANDTPGVGIEPEGTWANAVASPDYSIPNQFKYVAGDVIAYSPNVSLMKKFTVSYVVNSSQFLRAGVYTTTINYIASGRF